MIYFLLFCLTVSGLSQGEMVVPEVVVENIHPEDFTMDNLLEKEMMEEVSINMEDQKSMNELRDMLCEDITETAKTLAEGPKGRVLYPTYCGEFCFNFYSWCKGICSQLVQEEEINVLEFFPCFTSCIPYLASCCFT